MITIADLGRVDGDRLAALLESLESTEPAPGDGLDEMEEITALLQRHAADEARHYEWACNALHELGYGPETIPSRAVQAFARFHGTTADAIEAMGRNALEATVRVLRPV